MAHATILSFIDPSKKMSAAQFKLPWPLAPAEASFIPLKFF